MGDFEKNWLFGKWKISSSRATHGVMFDFTTQGEERNITRQTIDSPPSAACGIARYATFCDIAGDPYFPTTSIGVRRRGSFFNPCPTFSTYCGRLAKAFQMLGFSPPAWVGSEVQASTMDLKHAQEFPNRFDNSILRDLRVILLKWGSIEREFGNLIYTRASFSLFVFNRRLTRRLGSRSMATSLIAHLCVTLI